MPKGDQRGRVEPHNGKLRIVYHVNGKPVPESTGLAAGKRGDANWRAASALLRQRVAELTLGTYKAPNRTEASRTFAEYAQTWIESLHSTKSRGGKPFKPVSIAKYERVLRNGWVPHLGSMRLSEITETDIRSAEIKALAKPSQNYSSCLVVVLKKMMRAAARDGLTRTPVSPADCLVTPLPEKPHLVAEDVWSKEEGSRLPALASEINAGFACYVSLGLRTGMRGGEMRALRLENIDIARHIIRVRLTAPEDYSDDEAGPPKTVQSIRDLDIDPRVVATLRPQIKAQMSLGSPWLFSDPLDKDKLLPHWQLMKLFNKLARKTGRYLTPHRLRHTFASTALTAGWQPWDVARYMGDTLATVERHYATWADKDARRRAAAGFASMYDVAPISHPSSCDDAASS